MTAKSDGPRARRIAALRGAASAALVLLAFATYQGVLDAGWLALAALAVAAAAFAPPVWFGDEVTDDPDYANQALAVAGAPPAREVHLSNAALDAVLDLLDGRAALRPAPRRDAMESLRRAVAPRPAGSPVAALAQEGPRAAEAPRFAEGPRAAEAPRARFGLALAAAPERRFADPAAEPLREDEA